MARKSRLSSFNKQNKNTSRVNNNRSIVDSNRNVSPLYSWNSASQLLKKSQDSTRVLPQSFEKGPSKISNLIQKLSERRDDIRVDSISRGAKRTHDSREQQDVFPLNPLPPQPGQGDMYPYDSNRPIGREAQPYRGRRSYKYNDTVQFIEDSVINSSYFEEEFEIDLGENGGVKTIQPLTAAKFPMSQYGIENMGQDFGCTVGATLGYGYPNAEAIYSELTKEQKETEKNMYFWYALTEEERNQSLQQSQFPGIGNQHDVYVCMGFCCNEDIPVDVYKDEEPLGLGILYQSQGDGEYDIPVIDELLDLDYDCAEDQRDVERVYDIENLGGHGPAIPHRFFSPTEYLRADGYGYICLDNNPDFVYHTISDYPVEIPIHSWSNWDPVSPIYLGNQNILPTPQPGQDYLDTTTGFGFLPFESVPYVEWVAQTSTSDSLYNFCRGARRYVGNPEPLYEGRPFSNPACKGNQIATGRSNYRDLGTIPQVIRQEYSPGYQINSSAAGGTGPQGPGDFNNREGHIGCKQMDYDSCTFWNSPGIDACYMVIIGGDPREIDQACGDDVKTHRIVHSDGEVEEIMYACLPEVDNAARHFSELTAEQREDYMDKQLQNMCDGEVPGCDLTQNEYKFCVGDGGDSFEAAFVCMPFGMCPPECLGCPQTGFPGI